MHIEYRKKYPYFGKYKIKISVYHRSWDRNNELSKQQEVRDFLEANYASYEEYKWSGGWNVYLKNEDMFNEVYKKFPDHICYMYKPAPGYEDLVGVDENNERVLWYDKYPYKVVLSVNRSDYFHQVGWCEGNIDGDFKTSAGRIETSFYFMNSFDTMAFKLAFSDIVVKTYVANSEKAAILLEERMDDAIREYHEYLEGESDDE